MNDLNFDNNELQFLFNVIAAAPKVILIPEARSSIVKIQNEMRRRKEKGDTEK